MPKAHPHELVEHDTHHLLTIEPHAEGAPAEVVLYPKPEPPAIDEATPPDEAAHLRARHAAALKAHDEHVAHDSRARVEAVRKLAVAARRGEEAPD